MVADFSKAKMVARIKTSSVLKKVNENVEFHFTLTVLILKTERKIKAFS